MDTIGSMNFEVRTATDPRAMILALRRAVQNLDKDLPLFDVKTQNEQVDELLLQERMFAKLSSFFGLLALLLACVGICGMLSYTVVRRTGEIGIRMALGAHRGDILSMVLRETLLLVSIGTAIGVPLAWAVARLASNQISGLLFGLKATDHVTILMSTLVMAGVALFAGFLPALKASRVDPTVALRYE
jgi:ABC-type antimicrobial peptide transport system permease subunit